MKYFGMHRKALRRHHPLDLRGQSFSYEVVINAALRRNMPLLGYAFKQAGAEVREPEVIRSANPQLLQPTLDSGPMVDVREPSTAALGINICTQPTTWAQGAGGFFLSVFRPKMRHLR